MIRTKVFKWKQPSHQNSNGIIRAYLEKQGKLIGPYDMQIVAQGMTELRIGQRGDGIIQSPFSYILFSY